MGEYEEQKKQYDEFMNQLELFSLSDYLRKIIPSIQFEEEIGPDKKKYLKTNCMLIHSDSKLPTFYIGREARVYRCFDCGRMGGPLHLIEHLKEYYSKIKMNPFDLYKSSFESLSREIGSNISNPGTIEKIIEELGEDEIHASIYFDSAFLSDKAEYPDGTWKIDEF
jgi:hypothetical protein